MLDRIAEIDPSYHSYLLVTPEAALEAAGIAEAEIMSGRYRGPMHGIPIGIKDLNFTKGIKTTFGMRVHKDFVPDFDGTVVKNLKDGGAVILGKLHLHEGAFGEHHPDTRAPLNPWNKAYWPGGSSSGSGVATAAGTLLWQPWLGHRWIDPVSVACLRCHRRQDDLGPGESLWCLSAFGIPGHDWPNGPLCG